MPPWRPSQWLSKAMVIAGVGMWLLLMYQLIVATQEKARPQGKVVFDKDVPDPIVRQQAAHPGGDEISSLEMPPIMPDVPLYKKPAKRKPPAPPPEEDALEESPDAADDDDIPDWAKPQPDAGTTPAQRERKAFTLKSVPGENKSQAATAAFLSNPKVRKPEDGVEEKSAAASAAKTPPSGRKPRVYRDMLGNAVER